MTTNRGSEARIARASTHFSSHGVGGKDFKLKVKRGSLRAIAVTKVSVLQQSGD